MITEGSSSLKLSLNSRRAEMEEYLSAEGGCWLQNDIWRTDSESYKESGLKERRRDGVLADFTGCRRQTEQCTECPSFCSTKENLDEYASEIEKVSSMIRIGQMLGRDEWVHKNQEYLDRLIRMHGELDEKGIVHKSGVIWRNHRNIWKGAGVNGRMKRSRKCKRPSKSCRQTGNRSISIQYI